MRNNVLLSKINHDYLSTVAGQGRWSECFACGESPF